MNDPHDLERFVIAQEPTYEQVSTELRAGRKTTHWMWFIFPQLRDLGQSPTAKLYGIASREEATAYLQHPVLGPRLKECVGLVLAISGRNAHAIFGSPDDLKFRSSMSLFAAVAPKEPMFKEALEKYYGGKPDPRTVALIGW